MKRLVTPFVLCCLVVLLAAGSSFAQRYTVTDLGTLGIYDEQSWPTGINNSGQVVGWSGVYGDSRAFRTAPNSPINPATDDLGTLGGMSTVAEAINDSGQVVGWSYVAGYSQQHAFRTAPNSAINPATDVLGRGYATGINDSGQVVGMYWTIFSTATFSFRTAPNSPINPATDDLGTLGGGWSANPAGINASGQVVGHSWLPGNATWHAFRTAPNSPINPATDDLGTLGGTNSWAMGINASGQVVGHSWLPGNATWHAFRTAPNSAINPATDDLGTLGGPWSWAYGINASGHVVGYSYTSDMGPHAFLYRYGVMHDLNELIPPNSGWLLLHATGINDAGQIVGVGMNPNFQYRAFLLTPFFDVNKELADLTADVIGLNLRQGIANSLDAKLTAVSKALGDVNQHNNAAAIGSLQAFINAVEAQRGQAIPEADARRLIHIAQEIIGMLGT